MLDIFIFYKNSFSSATLLLTLARDNGIGIIIGEPSGGKPSHYGDILYGKLPNTGTLVTVSHKRFIRPNRDLADREYIIPDSDAAVQIQVCRKDQQAAKSHITK